MEMAGQTLKFAKKFIKEDNIDNENFEKVIEMKEKVQELRDVTVDLLVRRREKDTKSKTKGGIQNVNEEHTKIVGEHQKHSKYDKSRK